MIRVLIADSDPLVRSSLRRLLGDGVQLSVVGEADTGDDAVSQARWLRPDVLLLDARLARCGVLEACAAIRRSLPAARILVLGLHVDEELERGALAAGATKYLVKDLDLSSLQREIVVVPSS